MEKQLKYLSFIVLILASLSFANDEGQAKESIQQAMGKLEARLSGLKQDLKDLKDASKNEINEKRKQAKNSVTEDLRRLDQETKKIGEKIRTFKADSKETFKDFKARLDLALDDMERALTRFQTKK